MHKALYAAVNTMPKWTEEKSRWLRHQVYVQAGALEARGSQLEFLFQHAVDGLDVPVRSEKLIAKYGRQYSREVAGIGASMSNAVDTRFLTLERLNFERLNLTLEQSWHSRVVKCWKTLRLRMMFNRWRNSPEIIRGRDKLWKAQQRLALAKTLEQRVLSYDYDVVITVADLLIASDVDVQMYVEQPLAEARGLATSDKTFAIPWSYPEVEIDWSILDCGELDTVMNIVALTVVLECTYSQCTKFSARVINSTGRSPPSWYSSDLICPRAGCTPCVPYAPCSWIGQSDDSYEYI